MNTLTPFIQHEPVGTPEQQTKPGVLSSPNSPPLGSRPDIDLPPSQPDNPGVRLPPPQVSTPHPGPGSEPRVEYTDGTPAACRQKNAASFLARETPAVMDHYMPGPGLAEAYNPASFTGLPTWESDENVKDLQEWREQATDS